MAESKYRTISVNESDYADYEKIQYQLIDELKGVKLSMAQVIRLAMTFYAQRRNLEGNKDVQTQIQNPKR